MNYVYRCLACGTKYEKKHGMSLKPEFKCDAKTCDGTLSKVPSLCNFTIKGDNAANNYGLKEKIEKVSGDEFIAQISE